MKTTASNYTIRILKCPVLAVALLACFTAYAPASLLLHMEFNDPNTATTTAISSVGGYEFDLLNSAGNPTALQTGTGVSGNVGDYSLNGSSATGMGSGSTGPYAQYDASGPDITTGSLESFTFSGWFKTAGAEQFGGNARLFGPARLDIRGFVDGSNTRLAVSFSTADAGYLTANSNNVASAANLTEEWVFFAFTYDSTNTIGSNALFYVGTISGSVSLLSGANLADSAILGLTSASPIRIGNDREANNRPFDGFLDDFRLYGAATGSSGALSLSELEAVRVQAVPEPSTVAMTLAFGVLAGACALRRRRAASR